jgi:arylsulfatase A-like enzyme
MAVLLLSGQLGERERRPNVVVILIDDLGWADTEVYGSELYETPHVNKLASDGMRFTQAYAASPVCSPSRSALLTGNHPARLNQTNWIPGRENSPEHPLREAEDVDHLPRSEVTVAEALQQNGYVTAHMGKWHLGGDGYLPEDQGFDVNVAGNANGSPPEYFWPYEQGDYKLEELAETGAEGEYLTTRLGREAAEFIHRHADHPFFLHLSHYAVHTPLQAPDSLVEKYETKLDTMSRPARPLMGEEHGHKWLLQQNSAVFAARLETMDRTVGHVRDALRQAGVADETVVIFTSDNGGLATDHPSTSNYPLRAGKGWLYEGGVRVPQIVYWPGTTEPGSVSETSVFATDLYRTILEVTGTTVPEGQGLDGKSLVPLLRKSGRLERDRLYWHFPHYHGGGNTPSGAMRSDSFKLVQYFGSEEVELYDLSSDPREQKDLSEARPVLRDSLLDRLDRWRTQVDARMPAPNPEYRP